MKPYRRASKPDRASASSDRPILEAEVRQYLLNPRGEVDGFLLADGSLVKFPPHLARELVLVAAPGDTVVVNGHWEDETTLKGHVVCNAKSAVALRDIRPSPPDRAAGLPQLQPMEASGKIAHLKRNSHGDPDAAILEDGSFVHFPPHAAKKQFADLIEEGTKIFASGFGAESAYGRSLTAAMLGPARSTMELIEPPPARPGRHGRGPRHHGPHHEHHRHGPEHHDHPDHEEDDE